MQTAVWVLWERRPFPSRALGAVWRCELCVPLSFSAPFMVLENIAQHLHISPDFLLQICQIMPCQSFWVCLLKTVFPKLFANILINKQSLNLVYITTKKKKNKNNKLCIYIYIYIPFYLMILMALQHHFCYVSVQGVHNSVQHFQALVWPPMG